MIGINEAIACAQQAAEYGEFPVGAVVVLDGKVIGKGYNQKETLKDPAAHAEILAIRQAASAIGDWRLSGATLVSTLEPCPMCLGAIIQARIAHIVYLAKDLRWGACGTVMDFSNHAQLNHHCETTFIPNDDVVKLMRSFFKDQGKH